MAMVKLKTPIATISGSTGGTIFKRDRFCLHAYAKQTRLKTNPSATQKIRRNAFATCRLIYFKGELSQQERNEWDIFANSHPVPNRIGEAIYLTGFCWFVKKNINRIIAGNDPFWTPSEDR